MFGSRGRAPSCRGKPGTWVTAASQDPQPRQDSAPLSPAGVAAACGLLYLYSRFKYFQGYTVAAQGRLVPGRGVLGTPNQAREAGGRMRSLG